MCLRRRAAYPKGLTHPPRACLTYRVPWRPCVQHTLVGHLTLTLTLTLSLSLSLTLTQVGAAPPRRRRWPRRVEPRNPSPGPTLLTPTPALALALPQVAASCGAGRYSPASSKLAGCRASLHDYFLGVT